MDKTAADRTAADSTDGTRSGARRATGLLAAVLLVGASAGAAPTPAPANDPTSDPTSDSARHPASNPADAASALAARVEALEEQVLRLLGRVAALEGRAPASIAAGATDLPLPDDGLVWEFAPIASGSPLAVTYKGLDRTTGRVDLLVEVRATLAQPEAWTEIGAPVPLVLTVRDADGVATNVQLHLARGSRTDPGARLHLTAELDPALAAGARQMIVGASTD